MQNGGPRCTPRHADWIWPSECFRCTGLKARSREGFVGKDRQIAYAFKTTVENLRDKPVEVVVEDRVPVSEDERIQVERGKGTTPGFIEVEDRPGILEWKLTLAPKEKRELILEYSVRHPRDLNVPGL